MGVIVATWQVPVTCCCAGRSHKPRSKGGQRNLRSFQDHHQPRGRSGFRPPQCTYRPAGLPQHRPVRRQRRQRQALPSAERRCEQVSRLDDAQSSLKVTAARTFKDHEVAVVRNLFAAASVGGAVPAMAASQATSRLRWSARPLAGATFAAAAGQLLGGKVGSGWCLASSAPPRSGPRGANVVPQLAHLCDDQGRAI